MKSFARASIWLVVVVAVMATATACSFSTRLGAPENAWASRNASGVEPTPFTVLDTADGTVDLRVNAGGDDAPCIAYEVPGSAGGTCLFAVANGTRQGWAIEPWTKAVGDTMVVYGAAIPDVTTVRLESASGTQDVPTSKVKGFAVRFFAFVADAPPKDANAIVGLDADGKLVGRPHNNVGTTGKPRVGAYDGWWDARQEKPPASER